MSAPALFRLGSFSAAGERAFAGLLLGEQAYAVHGLVTLERALGSGNVLEYTAEMQRIDEGTWQSIVYKPSPDITDQWGTGSLNGRGVHRLGAPVPDPGLWKAAPR